MQPHEERVVTEKRDLDEKLAKLKAFCFDPGSPAFKALPPIERDLLEDQYTADQNDYVAAKARTFGLKKE